MKKFLCIVLVVSLCFSVFSIAPYRQVAIAEETAENLEYVIKNNEVAITGVIISQDYNNSDIVIPAKINGYPVTAIDDFAFADCYELESIEIPEGVISIGEYAFQNCSRLWIINVPETLKTLGKGAFSGCSYLDSITIPEGITKIENNCFNNCSSLSEIDIPESVEYIEGDAFSGTYYIESSNNWDGDVLYLANHLIATKESDDYYFDEVEPYSYTIKDGTKSISNGAFANSELFSEIIMPDSVKYVGESAFDYCSNLKQVTLSKGLTSISDNMFGACSNLISITIPDSVTTIGNSAFEGCTSIKSISVPNNVEKIGECAFYGCTALEEIQLPAKLTLIDNSVFQNCTQLIAVTIPTSVKIIGDCAFYGCSALNEINLPNNITNIGNNAFDGTAYYQNDSKWIYSGYEYDDWYGESWDNKSLYIGDYLIKVNDNYSEYTFAIKEGTKVIADYAFFGSYYLSSVQIPDSVISVGNSAFEGCSYLAEIILPDSVKMIGDNVFANCESLQKVVLSNSLTEIPDYAFYDCSYINDITLPTSIKKIGDYSFSNSGINSIIIPEGATEIGDSAFEYCDFVWSFNVSIPDSVTKIGKKAFAGTGVYSDWDYEETGFLYINNHLIDIDRYFLSDDFEKGILEIKDGTLTIADNVFENFGSLRCLIIPKSVKNIGDCALQSADSLKVICYMGSEDEWKNIIIGESNKPLLSATIKYNFKHYTPGDINSDTAVDLNDVVTLAQYVAKWDIDYNELALNVNGDSATDLSDVVHLAQFVAKWEVELAPEIDIPENDDSSDSTGKYNAFDNSNESSIYKNAPKGTVHVLMWRKYHKSEQLLIDQYQKLTGVKVKTTVTTEQEYPTKLVSMISAGNSPDVVMFQSNNFPGLVTKSLQSLNTKYFQLDSDCWNKNYMDAYRINGVYFGVAMPSSWSCESANYVTYYSPQILRNCGVSTTPYQLYQQGRWNWDTQADIIRKVKNKGFIGLSLQSYDMFMLSAGADFVKYDGSKYTNQLGSVKGSSLLTSAWMEVAELKQDDCVTGWDLNNVQQGKVGLFTAISYGLYNEGNWFASSFAKNLEAVPVAGPKGGTAYTPVRPTCWGVPKKANNPEGAAYFLRYYLDTSNYDHSSTFHNRQFEEVYNIITKPSAKKTVMHGWGVCDYVESGTYSNICNALVATTPANITAQLNSKKGSVQTGIARANKDLARIK